MAALIDIYTKLIIAFVSFIAPLMVYLLSVSTDGIAIVREQAAEQASTLQKLLKDPLSHSGTIQSTLEKISNKMLKELEKSNSRKSNLLNPKWQIIRIFSSFLGALFCIMLYEFNKDPAIALWVHGIDIALLIVSFMCFICGLLILRQIAWVSIDTKRDIEFQSKEREKQKSKMATEEIISP